MFESNIINIYGNAGQKWLKDLPRTVNDLALRWNLSDLKPFDNLSCNYVLSGFQGHRPIVLKLGIKSLCGEVTALKAFKGYGAIEVLEESDSALLLEQAISGGSLKQFFPNQDFEATEIASEIIDRLSNSKSSIDGFPNINDWLKSLDNNYASIVDHLPKARSIRDKLLKTMARPILLHGDLHHDNILSHGNEWKVIDPKGVVGEIAYEVGCFIRNPLKTLPYHQDCLEIITERTNIFAKNLNINSIRIFEWCYVQSVLAAIWAIEDNVDTRCFLKLIYHFSFLLDRNGKNS